MKSRPSAQAFTTGSNIAGYALDSVELTLVAKPDDTTVVVVSIHEANGSVPGAVRYADLLPSADIVAGNNTFNAPADAFLVRDTTYFVMVEYNHPTNQSASVDIRTTENNSEDSAGDDDWSIANNLVFWRSPDWNTTTRTDSLKIRIEGSALDGPDITGISVTSSPAQGDTYGRGETIEFAVRFDEAVKFEGSGLYASVYLDGTLLRQADYAGGSGTRTLIFGYTVQEGDADADGVDFGTNALAHEATPSEGPRGGGTITSVATGRDADLTNSSQRWSTTRIDGSQLNLAPPEITNIEVVSEVPDRGFYLHTAGDTMEFRVTFSEPVTLSGDDDDLVLSVRFGSGSFQVLYAGGSGTRELSFATPLAAQFTDTDGVSVPAGSLTLIGATTLKGPHGRDAVLTHGGYEFPGHLVNALPDPPRITNMSLAVEVPDRGYFETGDLVLIEAEFTAPVFLGGSGGAVHLKLLVGESELSVDLSFGSGTATPQFLYTVGAGHEDGDGVSVPAGVLTLDANATLKDEYGRDAVLTHGAFGPFAGSLVNAPPPPPYITGIDIGSDLPDRGYYETGDNIDVQVTFSRAVTSSGSTGFVFLKLLVGGTEREVNLYDVRQKTLTFSYTVQADDEDHDGVEVPANALTLTGTQTLKDRDDQDAVLTHGAFGPFAQSLVNTPPPPPYITGIDIGSDLPDRGYYETGDNLDVQVTLSRAVTSSGSTGFVFLKLLVGGTEREVNLYDVRQKTLTFTYAVQAGDEDHDGVQVPADAVTLTGTQTLKDRDDQDAVLTHGAYGPFQYSRVNSPAVPPGPPRNLAVTAETENEVLFRWDPPSDDGGAPVLRYAYRYGDRSGDWRSLWAYVGSVPEGEPPRRSWGLSVDADEDPEVCVEVMAVNLVNRLAVLELRDLEGNPTQENCVEPFGPAEGAPAAPESLSVTSVEADRAELAWSAPDGSGDSSLWGYRIEVSTDGGGSWSVVEENTETPARRWSDAGVENLAERLYRVRAVNTDHGAGNPSPEARLAPMALERLDTEPAQHFENPDDARASSHSVTATVELANPAPGREVHVRLLDEDGGPARTAGGETVAARAVAAAGTSVAVTFEDLPAQTKFTVTADVRAGFGSPEERWKLAVTLPDIRQGGGGPGRGVEVDANGDGAADAEPALTLAMGGRATFRVRPGACAGAKELVLQEPLVVDGPRHFGPVAVGASPDGYRWTCAGGEDAGEWQAIELSGPKNVDAMLAAPFDATLRHDVYTQKPGHGSWQRLLSWGRLVKLRLTATQALAAVGRPQVAMNERSRPVVHWDAVAGAGAYQVQWRWGSEAYGRVHMENGETSSREQRVTETSHTVPVGAPSEETLAQGLTVRVRAYDGDALTVGPWREAVLAATPGRPSGLTAEAESATAIRLAWRAPADHGARILGYGIEVSEDGREWQALVGFTASAATAHVHRSLEPGSQRFYRVRARNRAGAGGWSHLAGASTPTAAQANAGDALTVRTDGLPERGEGSEPFAFRLVFSEAVTVTEAAFRAHALAVTGGTVSAASRVADAPGAWVVTVAPDSGADVTVALRGGRPCDEAGAICTADGRRLGHGLLMAVPGRGPLHGAPVLAGFVLVDAESGTDLGPVGDGATVRLKDPAGGSYDVRVETAADAALGSVRLALAGPGDGDAAARTDDAAPWLLRGAADGTGAGAALPAGSYTLTATAYAEPGGAGAELGSLSVAFTVARSVLTGFVLVDATAHADAGALADGATLTGIDPAKVYGFRAEVAADEDVESVTFVLSGTALEEDVGQTESWAPYSLYGDSGGNEHGAALGDGAYTLTATAWSEDGGKGEALETLSVAFTVGEAALATAAEPLSAAFEDVPKSHAGSGTVTFRVVFSEPVTLGEDAFAAHGLIVGNATVSAAARIEGAPGTWEVTVAPASRAAVTVALAAGRGCAEEGALCTADGRALGSAPAASIAGPGPVLAGFELVDLGAGGQRTALTDGMELTLSDASGGNYGIVAAIAAGETVGSVGFVLDRPGGDPDVTRTESWAPYSLYGDGGENAISGAPLRAGGHTLTATAHAEKNLGGAVLGTRSVSFTARAAETATVAETALTAVYVDMPSEHDGSSAFTFRVRFSEDVKIGFAALRDAAFGVLAGEVTGARRVDGRQDLREITVRPTSEHEIEIHLDGGRECDVDGAICTADGRRLSNSPVAKVPGPAALSVADATANESDGSIEFAVTLDRAASGEVTVDWATADGSATAGEDYTAGSGTLAFAVGETSKTVEVALLDDAVDDGGETFTVSLSNPTGAVIADGEATGTIENADPMPSAWLVRFGRTVGSQVVDAVTARFEAPGASHLTLGGQRLSLDGEAGDAEGADRLSADDERAARETLTALADRFADPADPADGARHRGQAGVRSVDGWTGDGWMRDGAGAGERTMTGRELLLGSSFHLAAGGEDGAAAVAAWGRVATGGFDAEVDEVRLDGEVTTAMLGADVGQGRWLAGAAVAYSEGTGGYALTSEAESAFDKGEVESRLTSVFPYARLALNERVSAWGLVGYGTGTLTLTEENGDAQKRYTTDIGLRMGAVGARGTLLAPADAGGFELAVRTDALLVRTTSDATEGMAASQSDASRLRLILDGSRSFEAGGGTLTPRLEAGLRHDGGDAETGTGVEVGAGVRYQANGIAVEGAVRGLLAHEDGDYREWGASGSVRIDPGASGRGLSLTLRPTWGNASSGTERLWGLRDASGLGASEAFEPERRLDAELGYGLSVLGGRGVATPYAGWSQAGERETLRLGQRLRLGQGTEWRVEGELGEDVRIFRAGYGYRLGSGLTFTTEASRREAANDDAPEHALVLRASMRW